MNAVTGPAPILEVNDLSVSFATFTGVHQALNRVSLKVGAGKVLAVVGETGSGKSVLVKAIMRVLPTTATWSGGSVALDGRDLGALTDRQLREVRGKAIGLVVTNPRAHLNPVQPVGSQIMDAIAAHQAMPKAALRARALELVEAVGIPDPARRMDAYPHELSGGMCQRVIIAMALANRPRLVLADEPTAGLDVTIQLQIMELLRRLVSELGSGVLLVTRDLGLAAHYADEVFVMRGGEVVEHSPTREFFAGPRHEYSRMLLDASRTLVTRSAESRASAGDETILKVDGLSKHFPLKRGSGLVYAVNGVSFTIGRSETLALVGESGSGKTTVGRLVLGLTRPTAGRVKFLDVELGEASAGEIRAHRPRMQIVFQEPSESLDPRFTIGRSIDEPLLHKGGLDRAARYSRVKDLLDLVRMPAKTAGLYPHQISAGQQQRAAIARAIATDPDLIILDEPTSSLDISVRGEILALLRRLQDTLGLSYLFISHDLTAVEQLSHRIAIMYLGSIVEVGPTAAIFDRQLHPYGRALLSSVLAPDPDQKRSRLALTGEIPSPVRKPVGCPLAGRCPLEVAVCSTKMPELVHVGGGQMVACHRVEETLAAGSIEALAGRENRLTHGELVTR